MSIKKVGFDFIEVRDFLVKSYKKFPEKNNWLIDRWNFVRYVSQNMHNTFNTWPDTVGVWKDQNNEIAAVVNSEGENGGEAFIQVSDYNFSIDELNLLIDHLETLPKGFDDEHFLQVRINENDKQLKDLLTQRGYEFNNWYEELSVMELNGKLEYKLPKGFDFKNGESFSDYGKGLAHGKAFGYYINDTPNDYVAEKAFKAMRNAPDYNPALDLVVVDNKDEIASFATIWFDEVNKIGILEPVGTIPAYRRMGLGKALIYKGANLIKKLGANKMYVGSDQDFYLNIGFKVDSKLEVWYKSFPKS